MPHTYESLLQHWQQSGAKADKCIELDGFKLQLLPSGNFQLTWEEDSYGSYHTLVEVRSDGLYDCRRRKGWRRSSRCLQKAFGWNVEFAFDYPEVLGIKGRAYNLKRFLANSEGRPVYPQELYEFPYDGKVATYEQVTAALALQVLHYCRLRQHPQLQSLNVRSRHTYLEFTPRHYRGLVSYVVDGLFRRVLLLSRLREGEGICWIFPDLAAIEPQLRELAGDLGNPSTWHLPAVPAGMSSVPDLSDLDFSHFPKILPKRFGPGLSTQIQGDKLQILHPGSGVLVAEVDSERCLTLWDITSAFAREVHVRLNGRINRAIYFWGKVCYANIPNVTLCGPAYAGCRIGPSGICLQPPVDLGQAPEELAWQMRQVVLDWMRDKVEALVEQMEGGKSIKVKGVVDISDSRMELLWEHSPAWRAPFPKGTDVLSDHIRQWCEGHIQPFLKGYSLEVFYDLEAQSVHDLLMLQTGELLDSDR